jgi:hypothetical protein
MPQPGGSSFARARVTSNEFVRDQRKCGHVPAWTGKARNKRYRIASGGTIGTVLVAAIVGGTALPPSTTITSTPAVTRIPRFPWKRAV